METAEGMYIRETETCSDAGPSREEEDRIQEVKPYCSEVCCPRLTVSHHSFMSPHSPETKGMEDFKETHLQMLDLFLDPAYGDPFSFLIFSLRKKCLRRR